MYEREREDDLLFCFILFETFTLPPKNIRTLTLDYRMFNIHSLLGYSDSDIDFKLILYLLYEYSKPSIRISLTFSYELHEPTCVND